MAEILTALINVPGVPWWVVAVIVFFTTVYPILQKRFPKLPDVYGLIQSIGPPSNDKFPAMTAAIVAWLKQRNIPVPKKLTDVPAEALADIGREWDNVIEILKNAHAKASQTIADAELPAVVIGGDPTAKPPA